MGGRGDAKTIISPNTSFGDIIKSMYEWVIIRHRSMNLISMAMHKQIKA